jgi:uncharacterized protein with PIN domain
MTGKVSRWLRILGHDVKYESTASDDELLNIAVEEQRILLTRDNELFQRAQALNVRGFFLDKPRLEEKLAGLAQRFKIKLDVDITNSRCPICGSHLNRVAQKEVSNKAPKNSLKHFKEFWICIRCDKLYWQGTHWKNINQTLNKAKRLLIDRK